MNVIIYSSERFFEKTHNDCRWPTMTRLTAVFHDAARRDSSRCCYKVPHLGSCSGLTDRLYRASVIPFVPALSLLFAIAEIDANFSLDEPHDGRGAFS